MKNFVITDEWNECYKMMNNQLFKIQKETTNVAGCPAWHSMHQKTIISENQVD